MSRAEPRTLASQERTRRQLLLYADEVPPLPETVFRLAQLLDQKDATVRDIEAVLEMDPVLVGRILSLVNSALFSLNRQFESISDAVVMLGRAPLKSMALAYGAGPLMLADYSCYGYADKGLWRHSIAVASATRELGKQLGMDSDSSEQLFVAGLLHDIGKMLLAPQLNSQRVSIARFPGDTTTMESQATGIDHTEAGALVAAKWSLPDTVQEIIKHHHGGEGPPDYRTYISCLRLAEAYCHELGIGYEDGKAPHANYRAADQQVAGDLEWNEVRDAMFGSVGQGLASFGSVLD